MDIDDKLVELLLNAERSLAMLSGYVHGVLLQRPVEPIITFSEEAVIASEKNQINVATATNKCEKLTVDFKFTKKELTQMKENFVKHYVSQGLIFNVRAKGNVYEIRYRRDGLNLSASSKVLDEAKKKMKELLKSAYILEAEEPKCEAVKTAMEYVKWYIEEVKQPNHNARYIAYLKGYANNHLNRLFGDRYLSEVPFSELQRFMNELISDGKHRTAKGIRTLLKEVYKSAIYDGLVKVNHADRLAPIVYQVNHGTGLTLEEEKSVVQAILNSGSVHKNDFLILLFSGIRPCELSTLEYHGDFGEVVCAKKRTGITIKRKFPLTPVFRRYVDVDAPIGNVLTRQLEKSLNVIFGGKISLYDFRHTFITRAQECGVPQEVVQSWVGHSSKTLTGQTYTHFSDSYMLEQSKKMDY